MAKRKIKQVGHATVYRDAEWDEYVVLDPDQRADPRGYGDGFHTPDLEDALTTAQHISDRWAKSRSAWVQHAPAYS